MRKYDVIAHDREFMQPQSPLVLNPVVIKHKGCDQESYDRHRETAHFVEGVFGTTVEEVHWYTSYSQEFGF
jgi:hypothetical protein